MCWATFYNSYVQGPNGAVDVTGNVNMTHTTGLLRIYNLSGGNFNADKLVQTLETSTSSAVTDTKTRYSGSDPAQRGILTTVHRFAPRWLSNILSDIWNRIPPRQLSGQDVISDDDEIIIRPLN